MSKNKIEKQANIINATNNCTVQKKEKENANDIKYKSICQKKKIKVQKLKYYNGPGNANNKSKIKVKCHLKRTILEYICSCLFDRWSLVNVY